MNAIVKRDGDFSTMALFQAVQAVMNANGETVAALVAVANTLTANKAEKAAIDTDASGLWGHVRTLAEATAAATADYGNVKMSRAAFSVVMESVQGDAAKTVASYASTAGKLIEKHMSGELLFSTVREMKYNDVRAAMKSDAKKAIDAKAADIAKQIGKIKKHKDAKRALALLTEAYELLAESAREATDSREKAKPAAVAAVELEEIRQQAPSAPMVTETTAAAA